MISVISLSIASKLGLDIADTIQIASINGESTAEVTIVSIRFPNGAIIEDARVVICDISPGNEIVIGKDVMTLIEITVTNNGQVYFQGNFFVFGEAGTV